MQLTDHDMRQKDIAQARMQGISEEKIKEAAREANRCVILFATGKLLDAIEAGQKALAAWPAYAQAWRNLAPPYAETLRHEKALEVFKRSLELDPENIGHRGEYLFLLDLAGCSPEEALAERQEYDRIAIRPYLAERPRRSVTDRKIRVGYISADFYQHSAPFTFAALLKRFDREGFEVFAYGSVEKPDAMTSEFQRVITTYRDVLGWSNQRLIAQIKADQIDILVDLSGFTRGSRLRVFAERPAPIQVSGWGYATGMSLSCFDYFMADETCVPEADEQFFTESIKRLPCALSWMPPNFMMDIPIAECPAGQPFTFGVFSRHQKITKEAVAAWITILQQAPETRLLMKNSTYASPQAVEYMRKIFRDSGIDDSRVTFMRSTNHYDHMSHHAQVDLMLDTFPHGNGVTAFETLWMGTPLLTLYGNRVSGRITSSILKNIDMDILITDSPDEYVKRAVDFSRNPKIVKEIVPLLRTNLANSPMLKHREYTDQVELAYRDMIQEQLP